jgi:hypothetical protein
MARKHFEIAFAAYLRTLSNRFIAASGGSHSFVSNFLYVASPDYIPRDLDKYVKARDAFENAMSTNKFTAVPTSIWLDEGMEVVQTFLVLCDFKSNVDWDLVSFEVTLDSVAADFYNYEFDTHGAAVYVSAGDAGWDLLASSIGKQRMMDAVTNSAKV